MTSDSAQDSTIPAATDKDLLNRFYKPWRKEALGEFPFKLIFVAFAIAAPITLVGLPLGALAIVHLSGCCTSQPPDSFLTFWGGLFAGMLALFGMLIAAVFVISAFRIDKSAKAEARMAAEEAISNFILQHKRDLLNQVDKWAKAVETLKNNTVASISAAGDAAESAKKTAIGRIDAARGAAESAMDAAIGRIDAATTAAESASESAVVEIAEVRENVVRNGEQTTAAMEQAAGDVDARKTAAIDEIGTEVAEVERVAAEAKARIEAQRPDESPPSDSQE